MFEQSHDADDRRRVDGAAVGLIVEADVAAGDRRVQRAAGLADALHGLRKLPHDRRAFGVAEVQTVGCGQGARSGAGDVARRLGDRQHRSTLRVEIGVPAIPIDRHGQGAICPLDAHHAASESRQADRVGLHHVVVLPVRPRLARHCRRSRERQEGVAARHVGPERVQVEPADLVQIRWPLHRARVDRRLVGQRTVRDLGDELTAVPDPQQAVARDLADVHGVEIPFREDPLDLGLTALLDHEQHPLLRLRQHDLVRRHPRLALRHARDIDLDASASARSHLGRRAGQAGRTHVLDADERVGLHHLEARFE